MACTSLSVTRTALQTILQSVKISAVDLFKAGRVILTWEPDTDASDDGVYEDLKANGPICIIGLPKSGRLEAMKKIGLFHIGFVVLWAKGKSTSWDGQDISNAINAIMEALIDNTNVAYTGGAMAPQNVLLLTPDYDPINTQGIVTVEFDFEFFDPEIHKKKLPLLEEQSAS